MPSLRFPFLVLLSAALLSACTTKSVVPAPQQAEVTPTLSGQLSGESNTSVSLNSSNQTLAVTSVDASGQFTLTLPTSKQLAGVKTSLTQGLLADLGCTGTLTLGDESAQGYGFATLTSGNGKDYADASVSKTLTTRTLTGRAYLYADKPTTIRGPLDCSAATGYPTNVQVDVSASEGWNVVALNITGTLTLSGIQVSGAAGNGSLAPNSVWVKTDTLRTQLSP